MIRKNTRADASHTYTAQLRIKRGGKVVFSEARNFERKAPAESWLAIRRHEMSQPGALEKADKRKGTLADAIDLYTADVKLIGKTKAQVLQAIKKYEIADKQMSAIRSDDVFELARQLGSDDRQPQTVLNYLSHLGAIFAVAKSYKFDVERDVVKDALDSTRRLGLTRKSGKRQRRPTIEEMEKLMQHFADIKKRRPSSNPMIQICIFALFATRRQEEITTIRWEDLDEKHSRILVRDMKHPGQKVGNDVWCDLPPEAMAIIKSMPRHNHPEIFPYSTDAISAAFTRACQFLEIEDLHFHDLRHEGVSRLFEMGWTIPQVSGVSGHRSWSSLQRYSHLRQTGDKWSGWGLLKKVAPDFGKEEQEDE